MKIALEELRKCNFSVIHLLYKTRNKNKLEMIYKIMSIKIYLSKPAKNTAKTVQTQKVVLTVHPILMFAKRTNVREEVSNKKKKPK